MRRLLFTVLLLCVLAARGEEHPVPLDAAWTLPDGARLTPAGTLEIQIRPGKEANLPEWNSNAVERLRAICESRCRLLCMRPASPMSKGKYRR